jgi:hypothetical protein
MVARDFGETKRGMNDGRKRNGGWFNIEILKLFLTQYITP